MQTKMWGERKLDRKSWVYWVGPFFQAVGKGDLFLSVASFITYNQKKVRRRKQGLALTPHRNRVRKNPLLIWLKPVLFYFLLMLVLLDVG